MKLDKRIKSKEDIFDCFDIEKAEKYIGERGYFSNNLGDFSDLVNNRPKNGTLEFGTLWKICKDLDSPYYMKENVSVYDFFLPLSSLNKEEKHYRPFDNTKEFFIKTNFEIGDLIHLRSKADNTEYHLMVTGYTDKELILSLPSSFCSRSFNELFQDFELWDGEEKFIPFGVEVEVEVFKYGK